MAVNRQRSASWRLTRRVRMVRGSLRDFGRFGWRDVRYGRQPIQIQELRIRIDTVVVVVVSGESAGHAYVWNEGRWVQWFARSTLRWLYVSRHWTQQQCLKFKFLPSVTRYSATSRMVNQCTIRAANVCKITFFFKSSMVCPKWSVYRMIRERLMARYSVDVGKFEMAETERYSASRKYLEWNPGCNLVQPR